MLKRDYHAMTTQWQQSTQLDLALWSSMRNTIFIHLVDVYNRQWTHSQCHIRWDAYDDTMMVLWWYYDDTKWHWVQM